MAIENSFGIHSYISFFLKVHWDHMTYQQYDKWFESDQV